MMNQETVSQKPMTRQEYNRRYYQMRKEQIKAKRKASRSTNVFQLFSKINSGDQEGQKGIWDFIRWAEIILLAALVVVMTYFLVTESAGFYLDSK